MDMIKLKNGETIAFAVGLVHSHAIKELYNENAAAFRMLVTACRDRQYTVPKNAEDELKALLDDNLVESVDSEGRLKIHSTIRSVALSAAEGKGAHLKFVSPFEGDD